MLPKPTWVGAGGNPQSCADVAWCVVRHLCRYYKQQGHALNRQLREGFRVADEGAVPMPPAPAWQPTLGLFHPIQMLQRELVGSRGLRRPNTAAMAFGESSWHASAVVDLVHVLQA